MLLAHLANLPQWADVEPPEAPSPVASCATAEFRSSCQVQT
jgi:hypothetical protein